MFFNLFHTIFWHLKIIDFNFIARISNSANLLSKFVFCNCLLKLAKHPGLLTLNLCLVRWSKKTQINWGQICNLCIVIFKFYNSFKILMTKSALWQILFNDFEFLFLEKIQLQINDPFLQKMRKNPKSNWMIRIQITAMYVTSSSHLP